MHLSETNALGLQKNSTYDRSLPLCLSNSRLPLESKPSLRPIPRPRPPRPPLPPPRPLIGLSPTGLKIREFALLNSTVSTMNGNYLKLKALTFPLRTRLPQVSHHLRQRASQSGVGAAFPQAFCLREVSPLRPGVWIPRLPVCGPSSSCRRLGQTTAGGLHNRTDTLRCDRAKVSPEPKCKK